MLYDNSNNFINEVNIDPQNIRDFSEDSKSPNGANKKGDEFLIELYRKRPYLYDKRNPNFKNISMKQNAWNEMSKTMIEKCCGDIYTPEYCQRRCISLREQYNRQKKRIENESTRNTTPNSTFRQFSLYTQLTFLDKVIKRRKSFINVTKCQSDAILVDKNLSRTKTHISDKINTISSYNKKNQNTKYKETIDTETIDTQDEVLAHSPRLKVRKLYENEESEQTFLNMSNRIASMKTLNTADDAFIEFIKLRFNSIPEHEKDIRRKMMIDALSTPLPKT